MKRSTQRTAALSLALALAATGPIAIAQRPTDLSQPAPAERAPLTAAERVELINGLARRFDWQSLATEDEFIVLSARLALDENDGEPQIRLQSEVRINISSAGVVSWSVYYQIPIDDIGEIGAVVVGPPIPPLLDAEPDISTAVHYFPIRCSGVLNSCFEERGHYFDAETNRVFTNMSNQVVLAAPTREEAETLRAAFLALLEATQTE